MNLELKEQRGTLTYLVGVTPHVIDGNFRLSVDRKTVEARKINGRNRWAICSTTQVLDFTEGASR